MDFAGLKLSRKELSWLSIMLVPLFVFFINLAIFSVNIPYNDDYTTVYMFMVRYLDSKTLLERFNLIMGFWNDHRQPFNKLVTLLQYLLFGNVNVRLMQFIGNAGLIVIISALYRMFRPKTDKIMLFVPAVFMFFQTGYSENSFFGMASLTNFYVMAFGYLSVLILSEKSDNWGWTVLAYFLSVAAYFSQANGVLFLGIGLLFLLYRKDLKKSVLWLLLSIPVILFYRYYSGDFLYWNFGKIETPVFTLQGLELMPLYFFYFIGNCFGASFTSYIIQQGGNLLGALSRIIPLIVGIIVASYFIFLCFIRYDRKNPALFAVFIFLMLTAFGAMIERGNTIGLDQAITSRYRVVSIQFVILVYLSLVELIDDNAIWIRRLFTASLVSSVFYCGLIYCLKYEPVKRHRENLITSLNNWKETGKGLHPLADEWGDSSARELFIYVKRGIYRIPDY